MPPAASPASPSPLRSSSLVTLALLKAHFDAGHDHIEMFQPLLLDAIAHCPTKDFTVEAIQSRLLQDHSIRIPHAALSTLLGRAVRRGYLTRNFGRYVKSDRVRKHPDIATLRARITREHAVLASRLREFATARGIHLADDEEALALIFGFIAQNQIPLLLEGEDATNLTQPPSPSPRDARLAAHFITEVCLRDPTPAAYLQRMLEGYVLQNVLLLRDISIATRKFDKLQVFLDAGLVLDLLGLTGPASALAARDALDLLKSTDARLAVFDKTLMELQRILSVYETKLGTPAGRRDLRPTDLTRHLILNGYGPSDVRSAITTLQADVEALGIRVVPAPPHDRRYTLDEAALAEALRSRKRDDPPDHPRIVHDVDCVAAVLTLRAGSTADNVDFARAIFTTTNRLVAKTINDWYRAADARGVSPVIHQQTLSNLAWLKKPAAAVRLKLNELAALCSAAVRPTRTMWGAFLRHLRALERDKKVTSDQAAAVIASGLTYRRLDDLNEETDVDAATTLDVVERVKAAYAAEAQKEIAKIRTEAGGQVATALQRAHVAESAASSAAERKRQYALRIDSRVRMLARVASHGSFWLGAAVLLTGLVLELPGALDRVRPGLRPVGFAVVVIVTFFTLIGLTHGVYLKQQRERFESAIREHLRRWLLGDADQDE